jgi:hypothetical protein
MTNSALVYEPKFGRGGGGGGVSANEYSCAHGVQIDLLGDPRCLSRIPDPDFYPSRIPDPTTATKEEHKMASIKRFPFFTIPKSENTSHREMPANQYGISKSVKSACLASLPF